MLLRVRIVVTGAAGFVGSHLSEALLEGGHEVVGVDAFIPNYARDLKEANLAGLKGHSRFRFAEADLRSADLADLVAGAEVVVHQAAVPGLVRSWTEFDLYASCNLSATHRVLEAARTAGVRRIVHASTSSVYGESADGDETLPLAPVSPYGVTKLAAEQLVLAYSRANSLEAIVLRYFSVYGPRQRPDMAYQRIIEAALSGSTFTVFGDGSQSRSNTYIDDCTRGTVASVERPGVTGIFNVGGGISITLNRAIEVVGELTGRPVALAFEPARKGDQRVTNADWHRAGAALGYAPVVMPEEGLARQVEWARQRARSAR